MPLGRTSTGKQSLLAVCFLSRRDKADQGIDCQHYSNGATPVALWLGHLLFELPGITIVSIVSTALFFALSNQFTAAGYVWVCLWLYGIASTLYAYICALFLESALANWALVAGSNVVIFMLYL